MDAMIPERLAAKQAADTSTLGELFHQLTGNGRRLVRAETHIAKAKLSKRSKEAAVPIGMLAGAAVVGLVGVFALFFMLGALVEPLIGTVLAALFVAIVAFGMAFLLLRKAKDALQHVVRAMKSDIEERKRAYEH